jgi:hypothetical protein
MQLRMTSISASQPLADEVENENDIDFVSKTEAIGSQVASNLNLNATWALFTIGQYGTLSTVCQIIGLFLLSMIVQRSIPSIFKL